MPMDTNDYRRKIEESVSEGAGAPGEVTWRGAARWILGRVDLRQEDRGEDPGRGAGTHDARRRPGCRSERRAGTSVGSARITRRATRRDQAAAAEADLQLDGGRMEARFRRGLASRAPRAPGCGPQRWRCSPSSRIARRRHCCSTVIRNPRQALAPVQEALRLLSTDVHADVIDAARKLTNIQQSRKNPAAFMQAVRILAADPGSVGTLEKVLANDAYHVDARRLAATAISHLEPERIQQAAPAEPAPRRQGARRTGKRAAGRQRGPPSRRALSPGTSRRSRESADEAAGRVRRVLRRASRARRRGALAYRTRFAPKPTSSASSRSAAETARSRNVSRAAGRASCRLPRCRHARGEADARRAAPRARLSRAADRGLAVRPRGTGERSRRLVDGDRGACPAEVSSAIGGVCRTSLVGDALHPAPRRNRPPGGWRPGDETTTAMREVMQTIGWLGRAGMACVPAPAGSDRGESWTRDDGPGGEGNRGDPRRRRGAGDVRRVL